MEACAGLRDTHEHMPYSKGITVRFQVMHCSAPPGLEVPKAAARMGIDEAVVMSAAVH